MKVNQGLSQKLAKKINSIHNSCWLNAVEALEILNDQTFYIEGWIVISGSWEVLEHSWLEFNREIIDPSLYTLNVLEYFPGLKLRNPPRQGYLLPFVYHYGLHSKQFESYQEAFDSAQEFAKEKLKQATSPKKTGAG